MSTVRFGVSGFDLPAKEIVLLGRVMEDLGFDSLWWGEHAVVPASSKSDPPAIKEMLNERTVLTEPLIALAALSQATTRLKLGTAIILAPLTHPLTLARATATLFDLAGERFLCGLGAGWMEAEFNAMNVPFNERGGRLNDIVDILRKAWAGGYFEHHSRYYRMPRVQITPHATPIPLIIGGHSPSALDRAAARGDGWIYSAPMEIAKVRRLHEKLDAALERHSVDRRTFSVSVPSLSAKPRDVDAVVHAGFTNVILSADELWPRHLDNGAKAVHLKQVAKQLRVGAR